MKFIAITKATKKKESNHFIIEAFNPDHAERKIIGQTKIARYKEDFRLMTLEEWIKEHSL